jgi:hypothetical protein
MTEAILDFVLEERREPSQADTDRPDFSPELPMLEALRCLDELLGAAIARVHAVLGADPFRGLHIGPEDVERWLGRAPGITSDIPPEAGSTGPMARAVTAALQDATFRWLVETYALTAFQAAVLIIVVAPELDLRYERLFAYLQDDVGKKRPTVDLILQLLCPAVQARVKARSEFNAGAALIENRLITVRSGADTPLLACPVKLDEQIATLLLDEDHLDSRLSGFCRVRRPETTLDAIPIPDRWRKAVSVLAPAAHEARRPLRFYLQGPAGSGKDRFAEAVAAHLGTVLITADLPTGYHLAADFDEHLKLLFREAWFKDAVLHLQGVDFLRDEDGRAYAKLLQHLGTDEGVTLLSGQKSWTGAELEPIGVIPLVFDTRDPGVQLANWADALTIAGVALSNGDLSVLAERVRLTPARASEAVAASVNRSRWRAATEGRTIEEARPDLHDLILAARDQCGHELATLARRIEPKRSWDDIVLREDSLTQLREICARVMCHRRVLHEWGFDGRLSLGKGVTALFRGPSGTGKTLAAEIIAHELGLYLYKIDLSTVASKYIGETEKNLNLVFTAAHDANAVLFFDEADALFGKRSEVNDSHDRYANLEISYLLQKMEEFEGLAVLATNLHANMDDAFIRRLTFTVHFPFPSGAERLKIWQTVWPEHTPLSSQLDFTNVARDLKLSGGNVKNIALSAAYAAAAAQSDCVTAEHIRHALGREYQKFGKTLKPHELPSIDASVEEGFA